MKYGYSLTGIIHVLKIAFLPPSNARQFNNNLIYLSSHKIIFTISSADTNQFHPLQTITKHNLIIN